MKKKFFYFLFLSQFGALLQIASSYVGAHILILPLAYLDKKTIKNYFYIFPILLLSIFNSLINFGEFRFLEVSQRLLSFSIIIYVITFFREICKKSLFLEKFNLIKIALVISLPTILINYLELFFRFSNLKLFANIVILLKTFFIPKRVNYTYGTISGFFPEHGLFPPYLLMMVGVSLTYILFRDKKIKKFDLFYFLSISWIFFSIFHLSGLYYFTLLITIFLFLSCIFLNSLKRMKASKFLIYIVSFSIMIFTSVTYFFNLDDSWLFKRLMNLIENSNSILTLDLKNVLDISFIFKFLPFISLKFLNYLEFLFGVGLASYTDFIIKIQDSLPSYIVSMAYFKQNLSIERFALNSYLVCLFIELGVFFLLLILIILLKIANLNLRDISPLSCYKYFKLANNNYEKFIGLMIILSFCGSFLTILGAVPLLYPYPWISLGFLALAFQIKKEKLLKNGL